MNAEPLALHLDTSGASGIAGVVPWVKTKTGWVRLVEPAVCWKGEGVNPKPSTLNPQPSTLNPKVTWLERMHICATLCKSAQENPKDSADRIIRATVKACTPKGGSKAQPQTLNPKPSTLNPQPPTLNPQPSTLTQAHEARVESLLVSCAPYVTVLVEESQASGPPPPPHQMGYRGTSLIRNRPPP